MYSVLLNSFGELMTVLAIFAIFLGVYSANLLHKWLWKK